MRQKSVSTGFAGGKKPLTQQPQGAERRGIKNDEVLKTKKCSPSVFQQREATLVRPSPSLLAKETLDKSPTSTLNLIYHAFFSIGKPISEKSEFSEKNS